MMFVEKEYKEELGWMQRACRLNPDRQDERDEQDNICFYPEYPVNPRHPDSDKGWIVLTFPSILIP